MTTPIIILSLLVMPLFICLVINKTFEKTLSPSNSGYFGLAICFCFFALGHFVKTEGMMSMLPAWVPQPYWVVIASGILELLVAIGLLNRKFRIRCAWLSIAIFIGFLPVNIYAAFNASGLGGHQWGPVYLFIRVPLQLVLIGWSYMLVTEKGIFKK